LFVLFFVLDQLGEVLGVHDPLKRVRRKRGDNGAD
jgi:hypothetical protein